MSPPAHLQINEAAIALSLVGIKQVAVDAEAALIALTLQGGCVPCAIVVHLVRSHQCHASARLEAKHQLLDWSIDWLLDWLSV